MKNILTVDQINLISQQSKGQDLVLTGGCFDVLHVGHIVYLENAKKLGTVVVLLESDATIKKLKGEGRPVNTQEDRAKVLSSLKFVDFVVPLPEMNDGDYDQLVKDIKPDIIAVTGSDSGVNHKVRQAEMVGAELVEVTELVKDYSTTLILKK